MFPADFLNRYNLPETEATDAIELAISRTLTANFRVPVLVTLNGSLSMTALHNNGVKAIQPEELGRKIRRHLVHNIDDELRKRQTIHEREYLKQLRGKIVAGQIAAVLPDKTLMIEMELQEMFTQMVMYGECPVPFQTPRERNHYRVGDTLNWYITSVLPVENSAGYRVRIRLSRITPALPALMLSELSKISGIRCTRRIPGKESWIETPARIHKTIINTVGKDLREHLNVQLFRK